MVDAVEEADEAAIVLEATEGSADEDASLISSESIKWCTAISFARCASRSYRHRTVNPEGILEQDRGQFSLCVDYTHIYKGDTRRVHREHGDRFHNEKSSEPLPTWGSIPETATTSKKGRKRVNYPILAI